MRIRDFQLERYFARYEFSASYLLSSSDCETWSVDELLDIAGEGSREELKKLRFSYTESRGHPELLDSIDAGYGVGREGLVVGCPEELIFLFMNSFLQPGDGVVCISPAYQSLYELPRSIGCEVSFWSLSPSSDGTWRADTDRLESLLMRPRTKLLVVNFPHNPTGYMPTSDQLEVIARLAAEHGVTIFSDEMYRGLEPEGYELPTLAGRSGAVALGGLSKGMGLPGLRVGWLASRKRDVIDTVLAMKDYTTICNSAPGEFFAICALRNAERLLRRNREILSLNANLAARLFERFRDVVQWFPAAGGPTAFPLLLRGNVEAMCERAVTEKSLMVLPDSVFDVRENRFRVGMGRKNFPQVLEIFGDFLESWRRAATD